MQSNNVYIFPRQMEHYCTSAIVWRLLKTTMKEDGQAQLACAHTDIELGDFVYVMGTDSVMHRTRVIEALELAHPISTQGSEYQYLMLVRVKIADPKSLTDDCDIRNI